MKRILLTGMSGTGKSSLTTALAARGIAAVDLDRDAYSHWVAASEVEGAAGTPVEADRDWVWREDRVEALLSEASGDVLVVSGCAANMRRFLPRFDRVILLSAPTDVLVGRLAARSGNAYGRQPEEVARVLDLVRSVEPHLRRIATHEIDTSPPLAAVLEQVLEVVEGACRPVASAPKPLRLRPIGADGRVDGEAVADPIAAEVCAGMAALSAQVGFQPPWIGYLAEMAGKVVGTCAFKSPPRSGAVEIAYFSFPGHEGGGLATWMAGELLAIAARADGDLIVRAQTLPRPGASTSVLRRLGFALVGEVDHPEDGAVWEWQRPAMSSTR